METTLIQNSIRLAVVLAVLMALTVVTAPPSFAAYDGCYSGQVGLYTQANGAGHCYGFAGSNNSLAQWGINDRIRSGKNIGTSGLDALVYRNTFYGGGVAMCIPRGRAFNNPSSPQGESNSWGNVC